MDIGINVGNSKVDIDLSGINSRVLHRNGGKGEIFVIPLNYLSPLLLVLTPPPPARTIYTSF